MSVDSRSRRKVSRRCAGCAAPRGGGQHRMWCWLPLLLALLGGGCGGGVDIVDGASGGYLAGTVQRAGGVPVAGAVLGISLVTYDCRSRGGGLGDQLARSDTSGRFVLPVVLFLTPGGEHCIDVTVRTPERVAVDTFPMIHVKTTEGGRPDTTHMTFTIGS